MRDDYPPCVRISANLHRDRQPSLGSIRPVLVLADFCLKLSYPVFSTSKSERIACHSFRRPAGAFTAAWRTMSKIKRPAF